MPARHVLLRPQTARCLFHSHEPALVLRAILGNLPATGAEVFTSCTAELRGVRLLPCAAVQRGRVPESEGRGMADVLTWLFNDGSSSMLGAEAESMSVASLQVWLYYVQVHIALDSALLVQSWSRPDSRAMHTSHTVSLPCSSAVAALMTACCHEAATVEPHYPG